MAYFSMENSMYCFEYKPEDSEAEFIDESEWIFSHERFLASMSRGVTNGLCQVLVLACFFYAGQSGVNPGVISTIFNSSLIFTAVWFHFVYG